MKYRGPSPDVSELVLDLQVHECVDLLGTVELACLTCRTQTEIGTDVDLVGTVILVVDGEGLLGTSALALLASCASFELALHYHTDLFEGMQTGTDIRDIGFDDPGADLRMYDLGKCGES